MSSNNCCYDPLRSQINDDSVAEFLRAPIKKDLIFVPGIGPANKKILMENEVETVHQLIAKFMSFSELETDSVELMDRFYLWLQMIGIKAHRGSIVQCVAEKVNTWIPNIYDADIYVEESK